MKKTILIVEDDLELRKFLAKVLDANNFKVVEAADGAEALEAVEKYLPDLVLLDFGLPKVPGETVCVKIKEDHPAIIVIALTEKKAASDVIHGLQIGADDYIGKPFDAEELVARIDARFKEIANVELEQKVESNKANPLSAGVNLSSFAKASEDKKELSKIILRETIVLIIIRLIVTEVLFGFSLFLFSILISYLNSYSTGSMGDFFNLYFFVLAGTFAVNIGTVIFIALKWVSEYTEVSKDGVIKHTGILHKKEEKYACNFVEAVTTEQSLFGLLFNYGTIELYDPALKERVYLVNIANPKKYTEIVQKLVSKPKTANQPMPFVAQESTEKTG